MGYNARNDEIRDNITRMRRAWEAERNALATVRRFNLREICHENSTSECWFSAVVGFGNGTKRQRSGGP
jgi:hypothetical protein